MASCWIVVFTFLVSAADGATLVGPFVPLTGTWTTVTNGGFEIGLDGWDQLGPSLGTFNSSALAQEGSSSAASEPATTFAGPGFGIARVRPVVPGETYVLSAFFNVAELTSHRIHLDLSDVAFEAQPGDGDLLLGESAWQFAWQTFVVPDDVSSVRVRVVRDLDVVFGETAYVDEIAITLATEFQHPEPEMYLHPADCNFDGKVDGMDYLCWSDHFGDDPAGSPPGRPENGDYNGDGHVDGIDYLAWGADFGTGPNDAAVAPEPATEMLAMVALSCSCLARWRRAAY
jgi:hypothetical protein